MIGDEATMATTAEEVALEGEAGFVAEGVGFAGVSEAEAEEGMVGDGRREITVKEKYLKAHLIDGRTTMPCLPHPLQNTVSKCPSILSSPL